MSHSFGFTNKQYIRGNKLLFNKKKNMKKGLLMCFAFTALIIISCSSSDDSTDKGNNNTFNREAVLTNWVNNIITPAISDFNTKLTALKSSQTQFTTTPNETNLVALQTALFNAQKSWQHIAMFNFGKAEELNYRLFMNSYPVDFITTADDSQEDDNTIVSNIEANTLAIADIDFTLEKRNNEQGLPAVDYMVNGLAATNAEIVTYYTTNAIKDNYIAYLEKVLDRMVSLTNEVVTYWNSNANTVIANNGSSATASFDKLVNDYVNYVEKGFRELKIATPSGKRNGSPDKETVESFYSPQNSKELFLEAYKAVKNLYYGTSFSNGTNGQSIDDYLDFLQATAFDADERATKNITDIIDERFAAIDQVVAGLNNDFSIQVETNNNLMLETFNVIQLYVTVLKTSALNAMDVTVDFVDSDGD
ncbi:imelysin family protein [Seonamhaeicola algicola]|uniref:Imelysin family protein n=2 Tax=Seonamhaeicola algicola TaxID=1719036 RepID=A0A5C7AUH5_9FLAO|nr:imelysin family protein [Seonamhaeicola algicola]